jgi:hypothetical protein
MCVFSNLTLIWFDEEVYASYRSKKNLSVRTLRFLHFGTDV